MTKPDFTLEFIKEQSALDRFAAGLEGVSAFALDIETVDWWNRFRERVALVQIAFRQSNKIKVAVIDALAGLNTEPLRSPIESESIVKVIHNANFDASRLDKHYQFKVAPVFDTMLAARRSGERKYSLKAQTEIHLQMHMDKSAQTSDWSRRPLYHQQLYYAALDPYSTFLLYENQKIRNLNGNYYSKAERDRLQNDLPLSEPASFEARAAAISETRPAKTENAALAVDLSEPALALLGIITQLPTRYSPQALAISLGTETRVGLAGWIIDQRLGKETDLDEETVKLTVAELCERQLVCLNETRRLQATAEGEELWKQIKNR